MKELTLNLAEGGQARILTFEGGERVTVSAPHPYPPGSSIIGSDVEFGAEYCVKVRSCRRTGDQEFLVDGRLVNLSKSQREALEA